MTRKRFHLLFVVLTLLSVAVVNQSCISYMIASSIKENKRNGRIKKVFSEAINKGPSDLGEYNIYNVNNKEKVTLEEMTSFLQSNNYVVIYARPYGNGNVESIKFVPKDDIYKYYYKLRSGKDFTDAKKGKCSLFKKNRSDYVYPEVGEVYWSGEVVDGYINGKGSGLILGQDGYNYFEGEYISGIPVTDVNSYRFGMDNISDIETITYPKKEPEYFLKKNKNKLDQVMLDNYSNGIAPLQYEQYKNLANDVRNIIANYKSYTEDIILNEKTPQLSKDIKVNVGLFGAALIMRGANSPEELEKRQKIEAFKNFDGIDMAKMNDKNKELFTLARKPLLNDINQTLKYMDLLDGLALTSTENIQDAINQYKYAADHNIRAHIDESDYWKKLSNAANIADQLKNASTGQLREKYAKAKQKLDACHEEVYQAGVRRYSSARNHAASERAKTEKQHANEIDRYNTKDPSGKLVEMSGLFSSYKTYEHDGRISTKGGDYCDYNIIYSRDGKLNCYRIIYSTKKSVEKKDFKSLAELTEHFLSK